MSSRQIRSWHSTSAAVSIENFSFSAAHGYMIRDGKVAEMVKDVVLAGNLFKSLQSIDRLAADFRFNQMGGGCGKGGQFPLPVTEGAPHVRFAELLECFAKDSTCLDRPLVVVSLDENPVCVLCRIAG